MHDKIGNNFMNNCVSRKSKAKRNIFFGYLNKLVLTVLEFISRAFFIKILGENLLGVNGVFANVIQLLSLAELGMNNVVGYSFYKPLAENDENRISLLIKFYKKIYNIIALIVLAIGLVLFPFIEKIINTDMQISHINIIYLFFLADTVFSYLFVYKTILLNADQKGYINSSYTIVSNTVRIVLQIVALIVFRNIYIYLGIKVIVNVLCNFLLSKKTEKEFPYIKNNNAVLFIQKEEKSALSKIIKSGFVYKLSALLLNSTDNILISMILGTVWVGYISNYDTIYAGLGSFYIILFSSLTPSIGNLVETETAEKKFGVFNSMSFVSSWLGIVFSVCFFVLSKEFVTLWIGKKFVLDTSTVFCKSLIVFISCSMQPVFSFREALGLYRKTKYVMLLAACLNIGLSIWLGYKFGLKGILCATVISTITTYYWYEPYLLYRNCFFKNFFWYLAKKGYDFICLLALIFVSSIVFDHWSASSFALWICKSASVFCFASGICIIAYSFFPNSKSYIKKMLDRSAFR